MKKILLIQPPVQEFYDTDIRLQPIGLLYLKSTLNKFFPDLEVIVKDYHHGFKRKSIALPKELAHLREFYSHPDQSPFCSFYHFYHFGEDFPAIIKEIKEISPDLIGISSLFTPYFNEVLTITKLIKDWRNIPIIIGGSHPSALPLNVLKHDSIDYIIRGEGERAIVEFVQFLLNQREIETVSSLGYKKDLPILNPIKENYPLDEIPFPDISSLDQKTYSYCKRPMAFMITSRSCPHSCDFCSVHQTFGKTYRRRSLASIMSEIQKRYEEGIRLIDFEDDNLTFNKAEAKSLCRELIKLFKNGEMEFVAMNGVSYMSLDDELLELMKSAGFTHLNLSLVSINDEIRKKGMRPHNVQKYFEVIKKGHALGFKIVAYQILGLPYETLSTMIDTLKVNATLPVLLGASMFYLPPGSPIEEMTFKHEDRDWYRARLTAMNIETDNFKRDDIFTLFITTRIINFIKELPSDLRIKDHRHKIGILLLKRLYEEKTLYAHTKSGEFKINKFKPDLFFKVFDLIGPITNREGKEISISQIIAGKSYPSGES